MGMLEIKESQRKRIHQEMKIVIKEIGEHKEKEKEKKLKSDWNKRYEDSLTA